LLEVRVLEYSATFEALPFRVEEDSGIDGEAYIFSNMPVTGSQLNSIKSYDGSEDVELYFLHLERAMAQFEWEDADLAVAAKQKLTGEAARFIVAQIKLQKPLDTYAHEVNGLRAALRARFGERITELAAADAVVDLKQKEGESVDGFFDRVTLAMDRKNYSYTRAQKAEAGYLPHFNQDIYTFFGAGLKEYVRSRTLGSAAPPRTADALLVAARSVEAEFLRNNPRKAAVDEVSKEEATAEDGEDKITGLERQLAEVQAKLAVCNVGRSNNVKCFKCERFGHYARECPTTTTVQTTGHGGQGGQQPHHYQRRGGNQRRGNNWQRGGNNWRGGNRGFQGGFRGRGGWNPFQHYQGGQDGHSAPVWAVGQDYQQPENWW
jgi:hypothetical protein